jgi:hypothetical protein
MAAREQQNEQPKDYSLDNQDRIQNVLHVVVSDLADHKHKRPDTGPLRIVRAHFAPGFRLPQIRKVRNPMFWCLFCATNECEWLTTYI